jgi:hypothetical protein
LQAKRRDNREGHRDGAAVAGFDLGMQVEFGRSRHVGAGFRLGPRRAMQPVLYRRAHERVIRGMKLDEVHPVAEAIVGLEFRPTFVGLFAEFEVFGASDAVPEVMQFRVGPCRALAGDAFAQRDIGCVRVVVLQLACDVRDLVRLGQEPAGSVGGGRFFHSGKTSRTMPRRDPRHTLIPPSIYCV